MALTQTQVHETIATLMMDDAPRRNAMSGAMARELVAAMAEFRTQGARAVVLRAPPRAKVWSSGAAVDELPAEGPEPLGGSEALSTVVQAIRDFPAPVIALIEGGVWGGACEVALACDLRIAAASATFAITPAKLGLIYNISGVLAVLRTVPAAVAKELMFTGQPIDAARAWVLGIVNHVKTPDEIDGFAYGVAAQIALNAPVSIAAMKEEMRLLEDARVIPPDLSARMLELRHRVYGSLDYQEGLAAFREKRAPQFRGE